MTDLRQGADLSGPRSRRLIELNEQDRAALEALTRRTTVAVGLVRRARIVLRAAEGVPLDRIARELGLSRLIHAVGAQEEVLPLLSISDVFLLPSSQESFGLAALEAMACEVPVVASRVGGIPEVIQDGVTGVLHPLDALDEMADSAVRLLTDDDLRRRMGAAACRRVREEFCAERVVPMYEACYREAEKERLVIRDS